MNAEEMYFLRSKLSAFAAHENLDVINITYLKTNCFSFVSKTAQKPGAPNHNFQKISVRMTIWDLEFSEHLL